MLNGATIKVSGYYNKYGGPQLKQMNTFKAKADKQTNRHHIIIILS
jgi:hypothetical protein